MNTQKWLPKSSILLLLASLPLSAKTMDHRIAVSMPEPIKTHTLSNMRHHLQALNDILEALAKNDSDQAAKIAESQLGMSSLGLHGASDAGKYMPKGMAQTGMSLHHAASRFALTVVEENPKKTYAALNKITTSCIACHAQYKLK